MLHLSRSVQSLRVVVFLIYLRLLDLRFREFVASTVAPLTCDPRLCRRFFLRSLSEPSSNDNMRISKRYKHLHAELREILAVTLLREICRISLFCQIRSIKEPACCAGSFHARRRCRREGTSWLGLAWASLFRSLSGLSMLERICFRWRWMSSCHLQSWCSRTWTAGRASSRYLPVLGWYRPYTDVIPYLSLLNLPSASRRSRSWRYRLRRRLSRRGRSVLLRFNPWECWLGPYIDSWLIYTKIYSKYQS